MLLLNYDFYDIYAVLISFRNDPSNTFNEKIAKTIKALVESPQQRCFLFFSERFKGGEPKVATQLFAVRRASGVCMNPFLSAKKYRELCSRYFFIQAAGLVYHRRTTCGVYHQPLWGCISSRASVHFPAA